MFCRMAFQPIQWLVRPALLISAIAAMTALISGPASATPPRSMQMDETILAQNATHLFVLRRIDDNLGYHNTILTDVQLIARNLVTGRDDRIWPVMSVLDHGADWQSYNEPARLALRELPETFEPFAVLRAEGVWRYLPAERGPSNASASWSKNGLQVTGTDDAVSHAIDIATIREKLQSSLQQSHSVQSERSAINGDPGPDLAMITAELCWVGDLYGYATPGGQGDGGYAVRLDCDDDLVGDAASIYVIVPPVQ